MIQVTLDLQNEHVLADNLKGLIDSLSPDQVQEIASKALFKYMTDTIDYDKQRHIQSKIDEVRKDGLKTSYSYHNKSASDVKDMSDEEISNLQGFKDLLKDYKSPKESRLIELNSFIDGEIKKKTIEFVQNNNDLNTLLKDRQKKISDNFEDIVRQVVVSVFATIISQTISNSQLGSLSFDREQNIMTILQNNNLY